MDTLQEFASRLTLVDCLVIIAVLRGLYVGYRSGFVPELLRVLNYLVTAAVVLRFEGMAAQFLTLNTFLNEATARILSATILTLATFLTGKLVSMALLKILSTGEGNVVSRLIGAALGVARWIFLLSLIFMLIEKMPFEPLKADIHTRSLSGPYVSQVTTLLFDFLSQAAAQIGTPPA